MKRFLAGLSLAGLLVSSTLAAPPAGKPGGKPSKKAATAQDGDGEATSHPKGAAPAPGRPASPGKSAAAPGRSGEKPGKPSETGKPDRTGKSREKPGAAGERTGKGNAKPGDRVAAKRPSPPPVTLEFEGLNMVNFHAMVQSSDAELFKSTGLGRKALLDLGSERLKEAKFKLSAEPDAEAIMLAASVAVEPTKEGEGYVGGIVIQAYVIHFPEPDPAKKKAAAEKEGEEEVVEGEPVLVWAKRFQVIEASPTDLGASLEDGLVQCVDDFVAQWKRSQPGAGKAVK